MPELEFYMGHQDEREFVSCIFSMGCLVVPHLHYKEPEYWELSDEDSFHEHREDALQFYIIHQDYFQSPLEMYRLDREDIGTSYRIMPRNGGPTIDILCPGVYEKHGVRYLKQGMIEIWSNVVDGPLIKRRGF